MKEYVGIYIKTEKPQEQDGFGNKIKYHFHIKHHFHITTLHKYIWLEYVEVVFTFVAKAILFLCFFGFDIYPYILFHFKKCFLLFLYIYINIVQRTCTNRHAWSCNGFT